jgi:hypothetical protein
MKLNKMWRGFCWLEPSGGGFQLSKIFENATIARTPAEEIPKKVDSQSIK